MIKIKEKKSFLWCSDIAEEGLVEKCLFIHNSSKPHYKNFILIVRFSFESKRPKRLANHRDYKNVKKRIKLTKMLSPSLHTCGQTSNFLSIYFVILFFGWTKLKRTMTIITPDTPRNQTFTSNEKLISLIKPLYLHE